MALTDEQRAQIVPELNAAVLHLDMARFKLLDLYRELPKLGKGPHTMISNLIQQVERTKFHLRGGERSIVARLMEGSANEDLDDPIAAGKRCRQMFMRDLKALTRKSSSPALVMSQSKKKGKTRKPKKVLIFDRGKPKPTK